MNVRFLVVFGVLLTREPAQAGEGWHWGTTGMGLTQYSAAGLDYTYVFGKGRKGISVSGGVRKTVASRNSFEPILIVGTDSRPFVDPERPLIAAFSVKVEL